MAQTLLSQVKKGRIQKPHIILLYGVDGVGKTHFAASAPSPIFIGPEDGSNAFDVARFPAAQSWDDIVNGVTELIHEKHEFKTLVIDSVDWLEIVLHQEICSRYHVKSIELAAGGYGKGYTEALVEWTGLCKKLKILRDIKEMNIILIGHSEVVKFSDPQTQTEYDRYQLKLHKKSAALLREFVDHVLFANYNTVTKKDGDKVRAFGDGERVLYTERRPGFDAKSRAGIPAQIEKSWEAFERAVRAPKDSEALKLSIRLMLEDVKDETLVSQVLKFIDSTDDILVLDAAKAKLEQKLELKE